MNLLPIRRLGLAVGASAAARAAWVRFLDLTFRRKLVVDEVGTYCPMTENKRTVQKYMEAFSKTDREEILSCLTDDVEWEIPGVFQARGRDAFNDHILDPGFAENPVIDVTRMTEENDIVVAEGTVLARRNDGTSLPLAFCDIFELENGRIRRLVSYLMETKSKD